MTAWMPSSVGRRAAIFALVAIVLAGTALRLRHVTRPWVGLHNAWGGAMYGNIARNFINYGYVETGFAPVANFGRVPADQFVYYYHYPPLLVWLVSLSYHAFGVSEWSARVVPLLFSVASIVAVFALAQRLFGKAVGLLSALLMAVVPGGAYYGAHIDVYGPAAQFFPLLAFLGYARWRERGDRGSLALLATALVLGCATSWFSYFVPPMLLAHDYWFREESSRGRTRTLFAVSLLPVAVFGLFLLHRHLVVTAGEQEVYGTLLQKLRMRSSYADPFRWIWGRHAVAIVKLFSPPVVLIAGVWFVLRAIDLVRRRLAMADGLVLAFLGYGILHSLAFPSLLAGHDYLAGVYAPAFVIAAALQLVAWHHWLGARGAPAVATAAVAGALLVTVGTCLAMTRARWHDDAVEIGDLKRLRGEAIRAATAPADEVLVSMSSDRILQYYAEREMIFSVSSLELIGSMGSAGRATLFACTGTWAEGNASIRQALDARFSHRPAGDLVLYDLRTPVGGEPAAASSVPPR